MEVCWSFSGEVAGNASACSGGDDGVRLGCVGKNDVVSQDCGRETEKPKDDEGSLGGGQIWE